MHLEMFFSDSVSKADVASSKIKIGGFLRRALAIAKRCFCPPDKLTPLSPIKVLKPFGDFSIKSKYSAHSLSNSFITNIWLSICYIIFNRIIMSSYTVSNLIYSKIRIRKSYRISCPSI